MKKSKKLALAARLEGRTLTVPVSNLYTGEILAEAGEVISKQKALEIENAGVKEAYVEAEDCTEELGAKILSNGMVDLAACLQSWSRWGQGRAWLRSVKESIIRCAA